MFCFQSILFETVKKKWFFFLWELSEVTVVADLLEWRRFLEKEDCELIIEEDGVFVGNEKEDENGFVIVRKLRWEYVRVREGGQLG